MSNRSRWIGQPLVVHLKHNYPDVYSHVSSLVEMTDRYASNVESDLRDKGEHTLADRFLDTLDQIGPGEPVKCAQEDCKNHVSFGVRDPATQKVYCAEHEYLAAY